MGVGAASRAEQVVAYTSTNSSSYYYDYNYYCYCYQVLSVWLGVGQVVHRN